MKHPADMTLGERIMLTLVIVLVMLFALALFGWVGGSWEDQSKISGYEIASERATTVLSFEQSVALAQAQPVDVYADIPADTHLLALDRQALEQAYLARLIRLFDVWLSSTQGQDATNFQNGIRIARRGYNLATQALAKRAAEVEKQPSAPREQRK